MRILQIIDTFQAGGAERMAVNYANALVPHVAFSGIVATRTEGSLGSQINEKVKQLCLHKKNSLDIRAIFVLYNFVRQNKVEVIHAHSTSFFTALLLKMCRPSLRMIWHDHYGDSEFLEKRPHLFLKIAMQFFEGVIVVNHQLDKWVKETLGIKNVIYLPNFPNINSKKLELTKLEGPENQRIVCLANLRMQKNHFLLLDVANEIHAKYPDWTFHLVGKDFEDAYSANLKNEIINKGLKNCVFLYGSKEDVEFILSQAEIAILTSDSEGLPVALLEYGLNQKAVVVTNVGEINKIIEDKKNGFLVAANDKDRFVDKLSILIESSTLRDTFGTLLHQNIIENFSEEAVIKQYLNWIKHES